MQRFGRAPFLVAMTLLAAAVDLVRRPQDLPAFLDAHTISGWNSRGWELAFPDTLVPALGLVLMGWVLLAVGSRRGIGVTHDPAPAPVVATLELRFWVAALAACIAMFAVLERCGLPITSGLVPWLLVFVWGCSYFHLLDRRRGRPLRFDLTWREWVFLGALATGGTLYWLHDANSWKYSFIGDEVGFYVRARDLAQKPFASWDVLEASGEFGEVPVMVSAIQALCMKLFGTSAMSWRLSCALMAMVGVPFLFVFVKRSSSSPAAVGACVVYVASLLIAVWAKIGKPHAFALPPMLLTLGFTCLARGGSLLSTFLAGAAAGLGFLLWLLGPLAATAFLAVELALLLLAGGNRRDTLKRAGIASMGWILGAIPMLVQTDFFAHWFAVKGKHEAVKQLLNTLHTGLGFLHFQASNHFVYGNVCDAVSAWLVLLGLGFALRYRRIRELALFGICVFFAGTLAPYEYPPVTRLFFVVVAWAVLAANGVEWLRLQWRPGRLGAVALAALLTAILVLNLSAFRANPLRQINAFNQSLVRFAQNQSGDRPVLWVLPSGGNDWVENEVFGYLAPNVRAVQAPDALRAIQVAVLSRLGARLAVFVSPDARWPAGTAAFLNSHQIPVHVPGAGLVESLPAVPPPLTPEQVEDWPVLGDLPAPGGDAALEPLAGSGLAVSPLRLAVASDGSSYVLDDASRRVFSRSPGSREEHVLQDDAGRPAVFQAPSDMTLGPDGRLYVLDAANSIAIFGPDERIQRTLDLGPLGVYSPRGLAVAQDGTIAVADAGNGRVLVLDAAGRLLKQIGRRGRDEGELVDPMGVAFDATGGVVVVDAGNARLQRFAADGAFVSSWPRPGTAADVWAPRVSTDSAGDVWVAGGENEEIWRLPREPGGTIQVFPGPTGLRIAGLDAAGPGVLHLLVCKSGQVLTLRALSDPASGPTVRRER